MIHYTCDLCGKELFVEDDVRYVVKIEVYPVCDAIPEEEEDLEEDQSGGDERRALAKRTGRPTGVGRRLSMLPLRSVQGLPPAIPGGPAVPEDIETDGVFDELRIALTEGNP